MSLNFTMPPKSSFKVSSSYKFDTDEKFTLGLAQDQACPSSFLSVNTDYTMELFTLERGQIEPVCKFDDHTDRIGQAKFSDITSDQDLCNAVISVGYDKTMKIWDKRSGDVVHSLNAPSHKSLFCVDNTSKLIMAGSTEAVLIWDLRRMKLLHHFTELHADDVTSVKFSKHSNNFILTASEDYLCNLLDMKDAELEDEYLEASYTCEQPITKCDFIANSGLAYLTTNVNTVEILSLETMLVTDSFSPDRCAQKVTTLVNSQEMNDEAVFYMGDFEGYMYAYDQKFNLKETIKTNFRPPTHDRQEMVVRDAFCIDADNYIVCTDEGEIQHHIRSNEQSVMFEVPQDTNDDMSVTELMDDQAEDVIEEAKTNNKRKKFKPF